jgi:hypothetical protein
MYKPYFESQELTFLAAVLERACLAASAHKDEVTAGVSRPKGGWQCLA